MKKERLAAIRRIVESHNISTQEELIALLREEGHIVTQATVSRDINELGLIKQSTPSGKIKYVFPEVSTGAASVRRYMTIIKESVISSEPAGNLVVVKCHSGMGSAAGESIDSVITAQVVGTIAGDNTIFIAAKTPEAAQEINEFILDIINR